MGRRVKILQIFIDPKRRMKFKYGSGHALADMEVLVGRRDQTKSVTMNISRSYISAVSKH
ncbi:MAG: hypothetical protein ACI9G9_001394, partial [Psychromonas sp.]